MFEQSQKLILAATVFAMTLASSASYADENERKGREDRDDGEYVAITLQTDPTVDHEAACVALQLGMNLLSPIVPDGDDNPTSVEPAEKVVLFPTLGGVQLVNAYIDYDDLVTYPCLTKEGPDTLANVLDGFVNAGGEILVCPLCAMARSIVVASSATMGNGESIHELFIDADKVIDF